MLDRGNIGTRSATFLDGGISNSTAECERDPIPYAFETDCPVGAAGFEPLRLEIRSAELHPPHQKATYSSLSHRRPTEIGSKLEPPQRDVPKSCSISNGGVGAYGGPPYNRNLSSEHPNSCVPTQGRHET